MNHSNVLYAALLYYPQKFIFGHSNPIVIIIDCTDEQRSPVIDV